MAKLRIQPNNQISRIRKEIYGHFSEHLGRCIYGGFYVGENSPIPNVHGMRTDVVEAMRKIRIPVLRWPGGCFADEYHWMDGIGPKKNRKKMINTNWGGVTEDNSFGTHEYFELCEQLGCEAYVNGNLGSGTVREMSEWVEYITFDGVSPMADLRRENGREKPWKLPWFGVGNENWGCGGNMLPEYYANEYRRYQTFIRSYKDPDDKSEGIRRVCCGPNDSNYEWTRTVLETCFRSCEPELHGNLDGLSLHYYVVPEIWKHKGSATVFDEKCWYKTLSKAYFMDELLRKHSAIMDEFDPERKISLVVDEWGGWYDVEPGTNPGFLYQQNTVRDALLAGITLNVFNKHSERVGMANLAQTINVLQSVILTEGADMILTPTYHVFDLYKEHQNGMLVESSIDTGSIGAENEYQVPWITESVSEDADGVLHITLTNASLSEACPIDVEIAGRRAAEVRGGIVCGAMNAMNTFEEPECVTAEEFTDFRCENGALSLTLPPRSVLHMSVKTNA